MRLIPLGMMGAVVFVDGLLSSFVDCFACGAPKDRRPLLSATTNPAARSPGGMGHGIILALEVDPDLAHRQPAAEA